MKVTVLRAFPFSSDGVNTEMLAAGIDTNIPDRFVRGLVADAFVSVATVPPPMSEPGPASEIEAPPSPAINVAAETSCAPETAVVRRRGRPPLNKG